MAHTWSCKPSPLQGTPARIIVLTSTAYWFGHLDLQDLHFQRRTYRPWVAYNQSKLANRLFAFEMARRLNQASAPCTCRHHPHQHRIPHFQLADQLLLRACKYAAVLPRVLMSSQVWRWPAIT